MNFVSCVIELWFRFSGNGDVGYEIAMRWKEILHFIMMSLRDFEKRMGHVLLKHRGQVAEFIMIKGREV